MQIDQSPYCTCKQDTQERYLDDGAEGARGTSSPPNPTPLQFSGETFFFTNMKYRMNFLTEEYTITVQLTLILLLLTLIREKHCLNRTCVIQ